MKEVTVKLEVSLGPDTSDLDFRTGIHSGQVTAGVLRGQRSRFQLFGDTINTAARMESSGERGRIQASQVTADLLTEAGLSRWIIPRSTKMLVNKGKGEMQTYWVDKSSRPIKSKELNLGSVMETRDEDAESEQSSERVEEEDEYIGIEGRNKTERGVANQVQTLSKAEKAIGTGGGTVLEEFTPIIQLKRFDVEELKRRGGSTPMGITEEAKSQLRHYISFISEMYPDNAFHNFEHASHVTASVGQKTACSHCQRCRRERSWGWQSFFQCGPFGTFLIKENTWCAQIYKKSVAEQKSVDIAWDMLMDEDESAALRACVYQTEEDLLRFRQLVVNTVMATDIVNRELQELRNTRWETAFSNANSTTERLGDRAESTDHKATIVIEHLIQASDVSHAMQHWYIYKKWNERFFMECYSAYTNGRADSHPSKIWYNGEIEVFDVYVIPSHEFLTYATANREEWVREGEVLVQQYLSKFQEENLPGDSC
eukprot:scaffold580_cov72-Cylindrotheca_fusiformis.AAC.4